MFKRLSTTRIDIGELILYETSSTRSKHTNIVKPKINGHKKSVSIMLTFYDAETSS